MSREKRLRLNQVAREFNVGISTITDVLAKKGIKVENSPSTIIGADAYAVLDKEFGGNRTDERANVRDRINFKAETISLDNIKEEDKAEEPDHGEVVVIKSNVITVKEEIAARGPKIVGKIDLSPKPKVKEVVVPEVVAPAVSEKVVEVVAPKVEVPKVEVPKVETPKVETPKVEAPKVTKAVETKPVSEKPEAKLETKPEAKPEVSPKVESVDTGAKDKAVKKDAPKKSDEDKPKKEEAVDPQIQTKTYDERQADNDSNLFRTSETPVGPVVVGKIDVKTLDRNTKDRREKRKRITKDKVDVTKTPGAGQRPGAGAGGRGGAGAGAGARGGAGTGAGAGGRGGAGTGGARPTAAAGKDGRKSRVRSTARPSVRPEVSDEDVQKQIKDTLARLTSKGGKSSRSAKYRRDKRDTVAAKMSEAIERAEGEKSTIKVTEFVTVSELASMMNVTVTEVITACMNLGLMVSINQRLDAEALVVVAEEFGYSVEFVSVEIQEAIYEEVDKEEDLISRPPIVTVMGHVDHGKTSLLDNIRKANVTAGEAGGITQHIGAYSVMVNGRKITFLDTPGHEAFTAMRARGAQVTDVAIIIVAGDDSVMPQTIEAINHASAAGVPIVFAINKMDKESANAEHIKEQLAGMNYLVEDWGGKYQSQEVSAKKGMNLDKLLEKVLLEAEMLDHKANPNRKANGVVIESSLDKGRGYVSTVLVQNGTLKIGDVLLSGTYSGRVKAMFNENGKPIETAPPSTPVLVLGLNGAPQAGDAFNVMDDDKSARDIANKREQLQRMQGLRTQKHVTLDEIGRRIAIGNFKELNIIIKGDVDGSIEAMADSLLKLSHEEVQLNVIHKAVGQISESDVLLAAASNAIIVGFQVRPSGSAKKIAEKEEIEIRLYSVIYDAINDIKDAIEGMLAPITKEEIVASVEVLEVFKITKVGTVAGCIVREGKMTRNTPIRVIRDGIVVYTGKLGSLKRYKDDVKEVSNGMECGFNIESFNDIKTGDIIEGYETVEVKR